MITEFLADQDLAVLLAGFAAFAGVIALAMPAETDPRLQARMHLVARERGRLRERRVAEVSAAPKRKVKLEEAGQLSRLLRKTSPDHVRRPRLLAGRLRMAGLRGPLPEAVYLLCRAVAPVAFAVAAVATLLLGGWQPPMATGILIAVAAAAAGFTLPRLVLDKLVARRQASIQRAFPDALDLLLICVQSGLSIEAALSKVARDISCQSIELAEELSLTMAELSYLPVRWKAYANLAERTGLPAVKLITAALMQAERYGTSVSQALSAAAREGREMRLADAESRAAALPPKLAIPLVAFFLPVLLAIILMPGLMQASKVFQDRKGSLTAPAKAGSHPRSGPSTRPAKPQPR
jgi:tight adherence protein C